jgi:hypothetical protein
MVGALETQTARLTDLKHSLTGCPTSEIPRGLQSAPRQGCCFTELSRTFNAKDCENHYRQSSTSWIKKCGLVCPGTAGGPKNSISRCKKELLEMWSN